MIHIVICDNKELEKIINKKRTMLLRGYSKRRIPHSRIFINDELYFVNKKENISYYHAIVSNAESLQKLNNEDINNIFSKYNDKLDLTNEEKTKWGKKCICLIEFKSLEKIDGINIPKYTSLEDWLMYESLEDIKKSI